MQRASLSAVFQLLFTTIFEKCFRVFLFFCNFAAEIATEALVAELADALDLGSSGEIRAGSIPVRRTYGNP